MQKTSNQEQIQKVDRELEEIIDKRISTSPDKLIVIGTGITSSHLGDERNLREFFVANSIVNNLRADGKNVLFYLFDDSYDPLNFRQLRVAVNKDEKLIKKFEKYCGMPIRLIPDPYECHSDYSIHYQRLILERFYSLDIYPNIIDSYNSYESGLYDSAKETVFKKYKEIKSFLKKNFPKYTMKKIFYPVCPKCFMMEGVEIKKILRGKVFVECSKCGNKSSDSWKNIKGKFSWKIDLAVRWNVFKVDFEPYSKAYLDPDVGTYFIAKKLSEKFFGGHYPEIIPYGQILMDKSLSYKLLASLPKEAFNAFFVQRRKKDITLSEENILQFAQQYKIDEDLTFYEYILNKLQYDLFEQLHGNKIHPAHKRYLDHGVEFAKHFLKRELYPHLPERETLGQLNRRTLFTIRKFFQVMVSYKMENPKYSVEDISTEINTFLKENSLSKSNFLPIIRKILSLEHSLPMNKIFYFSPVAYLYECLLTVNQVLSETNPSKKKMHNLKNKTIVATL